MAVLVGRCQAVREAASAWNVGAPSGQVDLLYTMYVAPPRTIASTPRAKRTTHVLTLPLLTRSMIIFGSGPAAPLLPELLPLGPGPVSPPGKATPAPPIPPLLVVRVIASTVCDVVSEGWTGEAGPFEPSAAGKCERVTGSAGLDSLGVPCEVMGCEGPDEEATVRAAAKATSWR